MRQERPYRRPGMGATWAFVYPDDTRWTYTRPKQVESVGSTNCETDTEILKSVSIYTDIASGLYINNQNICAYVDLCSYKQKITIYRQNMENVY